MAKSEPGTKSILRDEEALRWGFIEEERDPCIVVSRRMEIVHINAAGRALIQEDWFGKRCFEVLPVVEEKCAFRCPTIKAVNESAEIVYCEERVSLESGACLQLGVAVVPLARSAEDPAQAVLLLRRKDELHEEECRRRLLLDAEGLRERIAAHLG